MQIVSVRVTCTFQSFWVKGSAPPPPPLMQGSLVIPIFYILKTFIVSAHISPTYTGLFQHLGVLPYMGYTGMVTQPVWS